MSDTPRLRDQRLVPPETPTADAARKVRTGLVVLARALIAAHHQIFPPDQDIQYVVTQRNGKVRVRFEPPVVRESGWTDS